MKHLRKKHLLILFFLLFSLAPNFSQGPVPFRTEVMDDDLEYAYHNDPDQYLRAYVILKEQVDVPGLQKSFELLRADRDYRARVLVQELEKVAEHTQGPLLKLLHESPEVKTESIKPLWITNMIIVEARASYLAKLSLDSRILRIEKEWLPQLHTNEEARPLPESFIPNGRERGLTAINAHRLWALGYTGYGTRVMVIDTDVDFNHRALKTQFLYNNRPMNEAFTAEIPGQICSSHGTNVTGVIVGIDRINNDTIGAAFNAKYINGPVPFPDGEGNSCVLSGQTLSSIENLQFALNPDGNSNTTSDIPDVINNSYGTPDFFSRECQNIGLINVYRSLDAVGVSLVFSSGNEGPEEGTLSLQASLNFDQLVPFVVGAVGSSNVISNFSSRGPSICQDGPNRFKPEVVAPGEDIRTTRPFNSYEEVPGTSFSAPYVTGAILLLKEAFPNLSGRQLNEALFNSAVDLGIEGEDNTYGAGIIDVYAAYMWLIDQGHTPTPALSTNNDVIVTNVAAKNLDCSRMIQPTLTVSNNSPNPINSLDLKYKRLDDNLNFGTVSWNGSIAPGETKDIIPEPVNAVVGSYAVEIEITRVNEQVDLRSLDNFIKVEVEVSADEVEPTLTIAGKEICSGGQSMLVAESDLGGTIRWYDSPESMDALAEGSVLFLENVTSDTTLYAAISSEAKVGAENADIGPNTHFSQLAGLSFDALSSFRLKSVKVFAETPGVRIIQLKDSRGNVQQTPVSIPSAGENRIELNFDVVPGEDYELIRTLGAGMLVTTNQTEFPYTVDGVLTITRATGTAATFYPYFYDWEIEYDYVCGRVPAQIEVNEEGQAPFVDFMIDQEVIMLDEMGQATVKLSDLSEGLVSYEWSFGDGFTSVQANPTYSYTQPGTYFITLYGTNIEGCSNMAVKMIEVQGTATTTAEQSALQAQINLFPNPAKEILQVDIALPRAKVLNYQVTNLLGQSLQSGSWGLQQEARERVSLSKLAPGTYILFVETEGVRIGKRFVKL